MRLKLSIVFIFLLGVQVQVFSQNRTLRLRLQQAVDIALREEGVLLEKIDLSSFASKHKVPADLSKDQVYKLQTEGTLKGYAYLGSAPSKERDFDYVLLFTPELQIQETKILIYRETFGREIETPRWLNQFKRMTPNSSPKFGEDIDGISGATISARSMTQAVNNALQTMGALHKANIL